MRHLSGSVFSGMSNLWCETHRGLVFPAQCDHLGHMSPRFYSDHFDDAAFQIWPAIGWPHERNKEHGVGTVLARYTIKYVNEASPGTLFIIRSGLTRIGNKSVTHSHRMENSATGDLIATMDCAEVFFDDVARSSTTMPDAVRAYLETVKVETPEDAPEAPPGREPTPPGQQAEWFETHRSVVFPWRCDHLGHMNARWYLHHFDESGFHYFSRLGYTTVELNRQRSEPIVAEYEVNFIKEMLPGQLILIKSGVSHVGTKSLTVQHRMYDADNGVLHSSCKSTCVCFDDVARASVAISENLRETLLNHVIDTTL